MKAVILAGGLGSRLSEETESKPKPMVEVGGRPILWHIMKIYSHFGINDFVICLGYKGYKIKEYFFHYKLHLSDVTIDVRDSSMAVHESLADPWRVTLVETGADSMTGGRLKRVRKYLGDDDFCATYGDGVANIDIAALVAHHRSHKKLATVTAVKPPERFGVLSLEDGLVRGFKEKPEDRADLVSGGFFVLSPKVLDYIKDDTTVFEHEPLERLVSENQLSAYEHRGFWQPMDTLRDKNQLEELWRSGAPPWRIWASND
jgi:glucose-1-phosphate cytidylyltransferase